jgi:hypothetical protein
MTRKLGETVKKTIAYSQAWKCNICQGLLPSAYQIDHVVPHSIMSDDSDDNLQALCPNCHSKKTQSEHVRIFQFKKKRALDDHHLCWFCLKKIGNNMVCSCDKTLKKITFNTEKNLSSMIMSFDKYCYIEERPSRVLGRRLGRKHHEPKSRDDDVLRVKLEPRKITVNGDNQFDISDDFEYTVDYVAQCVFAATINRKFSKTFSGVEVDISFGEEPNDLDGLILLLDSGLKLLLPERIFFNPDTVSYNYFITDLV